MYEEYPRMRCPHCQEFFALSSDRLKRVADTAYIECPRCRGVIDEVSRETYEEELSEE
jgi:DNA-directed RNA polymerase subunit RPC12/RpoP